MNDRDSRPAGADSARARLKQAQSELLQLQRLLAESQQIGKVGGWEFDIGTGQQIWTDETYRIHELDKSYHPTVESGINFYTPESRPVIEQAVRRAIEQGEPFDVELEIITAKGRIRSVHAIGKRDPERPRVFGFFQDITERKRHENLQSARLRLMEFANNHSLKELLVATLDEAGLLTASPIGFYHFLEADQKTLSLQAWSSRTTQEFCTAVGAGRHYNIDEAGVWVQCVRLRQPVIHNDYAALSDKRGLPPGHATVLREMVVPIFRNGAIVAVLGVGNKLKPYDEEDQKAVALLADLAWDFAQSKRITEALHESEERWKYALEGAGENVWDWDIEHDQVSYAPRWRAMLGYAPDEIGPHFEDWQQLLHPDDRDLSLAGIQAYLSGASPDYVLEHRLRCKNGSFKWILSRGMVVRRTADGRPSRMIGTNADVTERKEAEMQISFMAYHDRLTGLPNRSLFFDRFSQAISQARRNHKRVALLFLDLDGFKPINDQYGHEAGDLVLTIVAERILSAVRAMDTVARVGGDEFVVILGELDSAAEVEPVADKILQAVAQSISLPQAPSCELGASIGVGLYPDNGTEMDTLLAAADQAMYESKHAGRSHYTFVQGAPAAVRADPDWAHFGTEHEVGVTQIDEQHRQLAALVNQLNRAVHDRADSTILEGLFAELIESTTFHFQTEQDLMERFNYPRKQAHDLEHARLLADASHFKTRLYRGGDLLVLQSIKDWLLHHITTEDKPLGEFLKGKLDT